MKTVI